MLRFFLVLIFSFNLFAQYASWQIYPSFSNIIGYDEAPDYGCFISSNAIFTINPYNKYFNVISKIDGLKGNNLTTIKYYNNKLYLGYAEGLIETFDLVNNSIRTNYDILKSNYLNKSVKKINIYNDTIYAVTNFGIVVLDINELKVLDTYVQFPINNNSDIQNILKYQNKLWVIYKNGLIKQQDKAIYLNIKSSWSNVNISNVSIQQIQKSEVFENKLFILADNTLYFYRNDSLISFETQVKNIIINKDLVLLKDNSIVLYDKYFNKNTIYTNVNRLVTIKDSLWSYDNLQLYNIQNNNKYILNLPYDNSSGNVFYNKNYFWVTNKTADYSSGFYYYNTLSQKWNNVLLNTSHKIIHTSDDTVYVARWGYGARKYKLKNDSLIFIKDYTTKNTPFKGIDVDSNFFVISDIKQDRYNYLWFLSFISSNRLQLGVEKNNKFTMFSMKNFPSLTEFNTLYIDKFDNKWIGTNSNGILLFNENNTPDNTSDDINININISDGLNTNNITSIELDKNNELWVGTSAGINVINDINNPKNTVRKIWGMRNQSVNQIIVDNANRKWVATKTGGLFLLSDDGYDIIYNFTTENSPLTSNNVLSIALDEINGIIYISTTNGLLSFKSNFTRTALSYNLKVFPNPFIQNKHNFVTIDGLVKNTTIKIFNTSMELINEFTNINTGRFIWDGKDKNGNKLSSGIYIIFANDLENNVSSTKLAVIK